MSRVQRFFKAIFPKSWAESMEKDSRQWMLKCNTCNHEKSFWDIGGIRWKAKGNQKNYIMCEKCETMRWHTAYRKQDAEVK